MTHLSPIAVRHRRRNWLAFFGDYVFFGIGLTFTSVTTTLPAFAAALTDNKVLIGAVSAAWTGGWLLPQLFAARYLSNRPRKYPIMFWGQLFTRPIMAVFAVWLLLAGTRWPGATLLFFFITMLVFAGADAVVALAWFDLLGKSMAPEARGRMIGIGQVITGLGAFGAGALVTYLLGPRGPAFPLNYAIIFGMGSLMYTISQIACILIVEPPETVADERPALLDYLPQLVKLLRTDAAFGRVTLGRLTAGFGSLASTFYVLYATSALRLPPASIGLFAGAATVGAALAGILLGPVASRLGSHIVVKISTWCQFAVPVLALLFHLGLFGSAQGALYPLLFLLLGLFDGSLMLGFTNYVLEIAPPGQRPTYIGLTNTISGLLVIMPLVGGWVLEHGSYPLLFALTAAGTLSSALLTLRLPPAPRPTPDAPALAESSPHALPVG